jgi:hypothetical protein
VVELISKKPGSRVENLAGSTRAAGASAGNRRVTMASLNAEVQPVRMAAVTSDG